MRPGRPIRGHSAVLLPLLAAGGIDWPAFRELLETTARAGLVPAVNMDTGYVQLLDETTRLRVLDTARSVVGAVRFLPTAGTSGKPWPTANSPT